LCRSDRFITAANDLYCSAGLNAGLEIMVYLLKRYSHEEVAKQVEHTFLADFRRSYQHDFIHLADQSRHTDEAILVCQQWIEMNYQTHMTVQSLADKANMSLRTFKRRFTDATGEAPLHYIQKIRIEQGREYLKHSNKSVSEIAWEVGYEDAGHFNRLFKRAYGETPARWRNLHK
jgi:transcriptional regulator GlxA family with amidase domain